MATDTALEFDLGPLTWVQGEIDQALSRGLEALATFKASPRDTTALKHARAHVHQAAGAIQMVGLDAIGAYTGEIECQLNRLEELSPAEAQPACELIDRACCRLKIFLAELVGGIRPVPLKLFPEYQLMQQARGNKAAAPTDLFYPDLSVRAPSMTSVHAVPSDQLPSFLVKQRRLFQRGLLLWLRGEEEGARLMRDAVQGIQDAQAQQAQGSFWWSVGALLESIVEKGIESGFGIKQLCGHIDLQIRRFAEGSSKVADRMRREVLYYVAISAPVGPQVQAVQDAYGLTGLIPTADALSSDIVRVQPHLHEARDLLAAAKDSWLKLTSGRAESQPKLKQTLSQLQDKVSAIGDASLAKLAAALDVRLDQLASGPIAEPLAMEYATALLLAEAAVDNFSTLSPEFPKQVEAMIARLDAAQQNKPATSMAAAPILDEMARRAQERLLLAQVAREIQANLRHMEQVLDAFFRDHAKRADLATLAHDSKQIAGALKMLGLDQAEQLLQLCQQQIDDYAKSDAEVADEHLELLAESLSGLGFYVEAVEQQRPDRERLIEPLLARRLGAPQTEPIEQRDTVEADVAELKATLPAMLAEFQRAPDDASVRERLSAELMTLKDDSELIGDHTLQVGADAALELLAHAGAGDSTPLQEAIAAITESGAAPAPAPSDETVRLLETAASQFDAELLDIYLTEAEEVLDTVTSNLTQLQVQPNNREALATVRRGFHTLKGSGRMVGLEDLGEIAHEVEKIHNRLLDEDWPVTPALLALIDFAQTEFRAWVDVLRRQGRVAPDAALLRAAIARVEAELPTADTAAPVATAPAPAAAELTPPLAWRTPEIEVIELDETPVPEARAVAGGEALPAIEGSNVIQFTPQRAALAPVIESLSSVEPEEITVGEVTLSTALYRILCDEAQQHLATLDAELQLLHLDSAATPSQAMVRAGHTLCGINRTGGFPIMAATAKALEQCLLGLQERGAPLPSVTQPVLARAVAGLHALAARVRAREAFSYGEELEAAEIVAELETLRHETTAKPTPEDSETIAAREAAAEDETSAPLLPAEEALVTVAAAALPANDRPAESAALFEVADDVPRAMATPWDMAEEPALEVLESMASPDEASLGLTVPELDNRALEVLAPMAPADEAPPELAASELDNEALASGDAVDELSRAAEPAPDPDIVAASLAPAASIDEQPLPYAAPKLVIVQPGSTAERLQRAPAEVMPVQPPHNLLAGVQDDVDEQVLPIFLEEAAELYPRAGEQLRSWRRNPASDHTAQALRRTLHTFKGSARMAGAMRLGELTHLMESRLLDGDSLARPSPELFEALDNDLDHLAFVLDRLQKGEVNTALPWLSPPVASAPAQLPATATAAPMPVIPTAAPQVVAAGPGAAQAAAADSTLPEVDAAQRAMLRVRADLIDRLVNEAGEVAIARARVEGELRSLKGNLLELTNSVIRLRSQVREIEIQAESQIQSRMSLLKPGEEEFDPLEFDRYTRFQELTRSLAEGVNDVSTVQQSLLKNIDDADAALLAQARLSRDVQQQLFSIRTVPFGSLSERLYRILRQTAKELDKRANLEIRGAQVELDRSVSEKLVGPLEHLLRNALDHGIETREQRQRAGKPETGEIVLHVRQQGNEIAIELTDDGAGLDFDRIRDKARGQGLIPADADPNEARLIECIFSPGFSTATKVTQISGRGVGMDVVRSDIAALGGRVDVSTAQGDGTTFTLYLPLTLAIAQTVLVRAGGRLWALPAPMVAQVQQVKDKDLANLYLSGEVVWQDQKYPFFYLPRLLGNGGQNPETMRYNPVLLLKSGQNLAAVHVDQMVGNQEVVVKNIGPQLARVSGIAGATVLGTGEVVLIINPVQLAQRLDIDAEAPMVVKTAQAAKAAAATATSGRRLVMIVDDSLTVRKITSRLLTREGFDVITAKDGLDALQLLGERTPEAILLDIEMPRMDGFEFTKTMKADTKIAHIPIIMITSRTAEKHRNRARELGVDAYLGKPYQEEELLRNLRGLLAAHAA